MNNFSNDCSVFLIEFSIEIVMMPHVILKIKIFSKVTSMKKMWTKGNASALLVGMRIRIAILENNTQIPQK